MARGPASSATAFRMIPLGERGPQFRPEQTYFSVSLVSVHMPGQLLNTSKFAPVVWASIKHFAFDGEKSLIGLFPTADAARPEFGRNDRVEVMDLQLTPRIVAREEITVDFTLGAIKEKDYLAGALTLVSELASTPAAAFLSQFAPAVGAAVQSGVQIADKVTQNLNGLLDNDKLKALGKFVGTLRAPMQSGLVAFTETRAGDKDIRFDAGRNMLMSGGSPLKSAYVVLRLQCEETRPDWMTLPDLNQAWTRIREAALSGADIPDAIKLFRVTAITSPDLTRADADRLVAAAEQKFAPVMAGAESGAGDPGEMAESLQFFLDAQAPEAGAESMILSPLGAAVTAAVAPAKFQRALDLVLEHEGGFVDHPADPGGATNKGVTQKTYDDYRKRKGLKTRTVKELEPAEISEIYFNGYWRPAMCQEMPNEAMAMLMFDAAVNHGPKQAIKLLQQAAGMPDLSCDGKWGPATRARVTMAAANAPALVEACLVKRESFYRRLVEINPKLGAFIRGWMNRITSLREHLQPLLAKAQGGGAGAESAVFRNDGWRAPLAAAPPDFSAWDPAAPGPAQ
jgi:lysozyme family protein